MAARSAVSRRLCTFWLESGPDGGLQPKFHQFSGWASAALYERYLVDGRREFLTSLLKPLQLDYELWEQERRLPSGLFWQTDVADGMEESISGGRRMKNARPSINSYMYGNARAIAAIAAMANIPAVASKYESKATELRSLAEEKLWSKRTRSLKRSSNRESLPEFVKRSGLHRGDSICLKPGGATSAPGRNCLIEGIRGAVRSDECRAARRGSELPTAAMTARWNGPSWPFSTSVTLSALGSVLRDYSQETITRQDYFRTFLTYSRSQHLKRTDGTVVPFIDEDLNPLTGEWWARKRKLEQGTFYGRWRPLQSLDLCRPCDHGSGRACAASR